MQAKINCENVVREDPKSEVACESDIVDNMVMETVGSEITKQAKLELCWCAALEEARERGRQHNVKVEAVPPILRLMPSTRSASEWVCQSGRPPPAERGTRARATAARGDSVVIHFSTRCSFPGCPCPR